MEAIDLEDLKWVNFFSRRELVREKTRELSLFLSRCAVPGEALFKMQESFDYLAQDWIYSEALEWEGTPAWRHAEKLKALAMPT